jgi:FkbM family methyltransferase
LRIEFAQRIKGFDISIEGDGYGKQFWEDVSNGFYESDTISVIQRFSGTSRLFVDLGAASGAMTLIAASLGFKVISVEANRYVFKNLIRNIKLNPEIEPQVTAVNAIVAPSQVFVCGNASVPNTVLTEITYSGVGSDAFSSVPLMQLREIVRPLVNKLFVKIDIEGAEWALFGCPDFIKTLREAEAIVIVALHPGLQSPWRTRVKEQKLSERARKIIWWAKNLLHIRSFFLSVKDFNIYRTNGNPVIRMSKFIALILGGYHEFLLLPKK